jgi:predicted AAA+ superfamily ATPase
MADQSSNLHKRYLQDWIIKDALNLHKIAFVHGPRQVGKTTMVEALLANQNQQGNYFNWDDDEFRKVWTKGSKDFFLSHPKGSLFALDEIHKDRLWKSKLKGLYDLLKKDYQFLASGSARLDYFRKSGDSLQGRYIPYRLHPFSAGEVDHVKPPPEKNWEENAQTTFSWQDLLTYGGFPEPFSLQSENKTRRWQRLYRERMIQQDLRDLHEVRNIRLIESLALLLQDRASSQLSFESLRQDLSSSFDSIQRWIQSLEALYFCYLLRPYSKDIKYSLKKEPKIFLFDWSLVNNEGSRFENMIAGHLLKSCHAWTDCAMGEFELHYIRDKQKREVDFFITNNKKSWALIEVKSGQSTPTPSLIHYKNILQPKFCFQIVKEKKKEKLNSLSHPGIQSICVERFLSALV